VNRALAFLLWGTRATFLVLAIFILAYSNTIAKAQNVETGAVDMPEYSGEDAATTVDTVSAGSWTEDKKVTSVGKAAARAREFLNWTLSIEEAGFSSSTSNSPQALLKLWSAVRNIVVFLYVGIIIIIAFGLILHLNWAEKSRRTLVSLIIVFALTFFSFSAEILTIRMVDKLQNSFFSIHKSGEVGLTADQKHLRAEDLLTVAFNYQSFTGYRKVGVKYEEAIDSHLRLVKATTYTNYAIAFLLILRIIILWGLVIFSPFVLPFFVFQVTKKVAIVWVREFFRWLFLGPLFALFLTAIPYIWQKTTVNVSQVYPGQNAKESGIPIEINTNILRDKRSGQTTGNVYQSGTNLLLTPPKNTNLSLTHQDVISNGNNLTETDTYARYIIALMMIWGAILLPFLLLRIISSFTVEIGKSISNVWNKSAAQQYISSVQTKISPPPTKPISPRPGPGIYKDYREKITSTTIPAVLKDRSKLIRDKTSISYIMGLTGLRQAAPQAMEFLSENKKTLADLSKLEQNNQELNVANELLNKLAKPEAAKDKIEADKLAGIKQAIADKELTGDELAKSVRSALDKDTSKISNEDALEQTKEDILKNAIEQFHSQTQVKNGLRDKLTSQANTNEFAKNALVALDKLSELRSALSQDKLSHEQRQQITNQIVSVNHPEMADSETTQSQFAALKSVLETGERLSDPHATAINKQIQAITNTYYKENPQMKQKTQQNTATNYLNSLNTIRQAIATRTDHGAQLAIRAIDKITAALGNQTELLNNIKANGLKLVAINALKIKNIDKLDQQEKEEFTALKDQIDQGITNQDQRFNEYQKSTEDVIEQSKDLDQVGADNTDDLRTLLVADEDFARVKKMWEGYYSNAQVPISQEIKTRADWITKEKSAMQKALDGLLSSDPAERESALKSVGKILPFVLIGKYKNSEVAKYLLAKFDAADTVYKQITNKKEENEEDLVLVKKTTQTDRNKNVMTLDEPETSKPTPN